MTKQEIREHNQICKRQKKLMSDIIDVCKDTMDIKEYWDNPNHPNHSRFDSELKLEHVKHFLNEIIIPKLEL